MTMSQFFAKRLKVGGIAEPKFNGLDKAIPGLT